MFIRNDRVGKAEGPSAPFFERIKRQWQFRNFNWTKFWPTTREQVGGDYGHGVMPREREKGRREMCLF